MIEAAPGPGGAFDTVLVVDFGAQYAQLIARRVRECEVYSEIVPAAITAAEVSARRPAGVILSGGPASVHVEGAPTLDPAIYELGVPILGICYGAQLIAEQLGGSVGPNERGEYGRAEMTVAGDGGVLLAGLPSRQPVWMSHFDAIAEPPAGATVTAATEASPVAAFENPERGLFGVQFHPEVEHTAHGHDVMERFLRRACGAGPSWSMHSIIDAAVTSVQNQVGDGRAICGLSGGVDSAVAAALVHKAIGTRLTCVLVDTGLLREGEADQVEETFGRHFGVDLVRLDAATEFFSALEGVTEPEAKRKVVGEQFIRAFERARNQVPDAAFLVQGTLYPDVIESGATTHSSTIKSHHNVGGLPDDLDFELVEPLRSLFKDEVRAVGAQLGLPSEIVHRQPFPGPGLAVRIIGEVTPEAADTLRHADAIVRSELRAAGLEREIWQSFAVLPDIRTVGVMGDERTYGRPVVIRAVTSSDAMTADWARLPHDVLEAMSSRVIAEVDGVNRVVYDITSKPPATIEWE
ncbi:MAG: glutamine-hydrolyzing GMP synthase [Acidimicrobiaceae bacterium]|nr:glutamine-hydrolyzing GMP synthase [Acidimicrobiaceae bacterium]